jgi:desulfoferrodoxin-like iron-binding protein
VPRTLLDVGGSTAMALKVGKRYRCEECGTEVLVTKPSPGDLLCCRAQMGQLQPKKTASAD